MKRAIYRTGTTFLDLAGAGRAYWRLLHANDVALLTYHSVVREPPAFYDWCHLDETAFRRQAEYLSRNVEVVPFTDLDREDREPNNRPKVVITFDDGYLNNYTTAFPILQEYNLPATIFLNTAFIGTDTTPWFGQLHLALADTGKEEIEWAGSRYRLAGPKDLPVAYRALAAHLKELPQPALLKELAGILEALGTGTPAVPPGSLFRFLNATQVEAMHASGLVTFGAHTHTHAILGRLDEEQQREEISRSIEGVSKLTGDPCTLFAYPNGAPEDYDETTIEILREQGIRGAATCTIGSVKAGDDPLKLKRFGIGANETEGGFRLKAHQVPLR